MKLFSVILIFVLVFAFRCDAMVLSHDEEALLFVKYLNDFGIEPTEEFLSRQQIFIENYKMVQNHNLRFDQGLETYTMEINEFSAYTFDELIKMKTGYNREMNSTFQYEQRIFTDDPLMKLVDDVDLPEEFDWREKGAVRGVQNQGQCGCCFVFAAVASIEGQMSIKFNSHDKLSEQEVVGCLPNSCDGGNALLVYRYSYNHKGITLEKNNPYDPKFNRDDLPDTKGCITNTPRTPNSKVVKVSHVPKDENEIQKYLVKIGPLFTAFQVVDSFFHYHGEIFSDPNQECQDVEGNWHAVLIVGYGSDDGQDYWIVKNSWGEGWGGYSGYFKMQRGTNLCNFGTDTSAPVLEGAGDEKFRPIGLEMETRKHSRIHKFLMTLERIED